MRAINNKSDFDFVLRLMACAADGSDERVEIGWPDFDWRARIYTSSKLGAYEASCIGGECTNCYNDGGKIHVVVNGHRMGTGRLNIEVRADYPDNIYPDGVRTEVSPQPLDIELVSGRGDCGTAAEVQATVPYIKFKYEDLSEAEKAEISKPATEAAAKAQAAVSDVEKAQKSAEQAEAARVESEKARAEAEAARASAEVTRAASESQRSKDEQARATAEGGRATAEEARVQAEAARAEEFAAWQSEIEGKQDALTTTEDLSISTDNELSLTDMAKKRLFIDMWDKAWGADGKYDPDNALDAEHPFMGNGIWMTYEEALTVYAGRCEPLDELSGHWRLYKGRTTLSERNPPYATSYNLDRAAMSSKVEVLRLCGGTGMIWCSSVVHLCANCYELREIYPILRDETKSPQYFYDNWLAAFGACPNLELVKIFGIKNNINFTTSPKLKFVVFRYLVDNAANTSAITVTVHADVYAKLTGDMTNAAAAALTEAELAQWQQLVTDAAAKNISFATV